MESVMYANHGVRTHLGESHGVREVEAPPPVKPGSQGGL